MISLLYDFYSFVGNESFLILNKLGYKKSTKHTFNKIKLNTKTRINGKNENEKREKEEESKKT